MATRDSSLSVMTGILKLSRNSIQRFNFLRIEEETLRVFVYRLNIQIGEGGRDLARKWDAFTHAHK